MLVVKSNNAFIHPTAGFKIFQLSEAQINNLTRMITDCTNLASNAAANFLSFRATRIEPHRALALNIYRNKYKRRAASDKPLRCVQRLEDRPDNMDMLERLNRD